MAPMALVHSAGTPSSLRSEYRNRQMPAVPLQPLAGDPGDEESHTEGQTRVCRHFENRVSHGLVSPVIVSLLYFSASGARNLSPVP